MAKEDFCYTYYDGDAARDKAHMNRLERGAYDDVISAQRKRGRLSVDDLKRVLGSDFEACFPSLEWVLLKDGEGKYYIEWVEKSIEKMRRHSEKQKENAKSRWEKEKLGNPKGMPPHKNGINSALPLENGNEDGIGNEKEIEEENERQRKIETEKLLVPSMLAEFKKTNSNYPVDVDKDFKALLKISDFIADKSNIQKGFGEAYTAAIISYWQQICSHVQKDNFFKNYSISQIEKHIQSIVLNIQNGTGNNTFKKSNQPITGNDLNQAHTKYFGAK